MKQTETQDFSLVLGGPLYQLLRRTRLLTPPFDLLKRRMAVLMALAWLPLLALTLYDHNALSGIEAPFLFDIDSHVRFLVALPMLVFAELFVHLRLRQVVLQFVDNGIVAPEERARFDGIMESTMRLRNSVFVEVVLLVAVFTLGHWLWSRHMALTVSTWYAVDTGDRFRFTPAGYWYAFVSIPIFQFLLIRWYYRLALWFRFLWKASRLKLRIIATHPDGSGGLGFLSLSVEAFGPILLAHSILLAGMIGNRIWHEGASLLNFKLEILGIVALLMSLVLVPLMVFTPQLLRAKRVGLIEFDALAERYVRRFDEKWIRGQAPEGEELVGSSDIQSLADLANGHAVVSAMWPVPFQKETILRLAFVLILPFLPLTLTIIPLEKMLDKLVGVIL
jgi:hypothetical protein